MDEMNIKECEAAVEAVRKCESEEELGTLLWNMVELNAGSTFYTSKKLPFTYRVKGRELFCDRKEKSKMCIRDRIRDEQLAKGIILEDTREGVKWKRA